MRAVIHQTFGEPSDVLTVAELPTPEPGPGQVRVRTILSPIHNHNLWTIRGIYGFKPDLPAQAGTEAVGTVDALGEGVTGLSAGQRVATGGTFGAWAEFFLADAGELLPISDDFSDEDAAQLVSMPFSAISLLATIELSEGDWIVQNAANGTVGRLIAQLAKARGLNVLGLVRRSAAIDELHAQGIETVVATDVNDWTERVTALTSGARIAVAIDSVGGTASGDLTSVLSPGGKLIVFGGMDSPVMGIPSGDVMFKNLTVEGFWSSQMTATMKATTRHALLTELEHRLHDGTLTVPVESTYSFEQAREASAANAHPGRTGKILLRP